MLLAVLIIVFGFTLGFAIFMIDGFFGGLDFTTSKSATNKVAEIIKSYGLENSVLYDLGSGRGYFSTTIARTYPKLKIYGVDDNQFRILFSRARCKFLKNVNFKKEDIFNTDVSLANIVYLYLPIELMPRIKVRCNSYF
jgi:trans-aconitate methyltransferase